MCYGNKRRMVALLFIVGLVTGCKEDATELFSENGTPTSGSQTQWAPGGTTGTAGESGEIHRPVEGGRTDGGLIPLENYLFCGASGQIVLKPRQSITLSWSLKDGYTATEALQMHLESSADLDDLGSVTPKDLLSATYTAPQSVDEEVLIRVIAQVGSNTSESVCTIRLIPESELGVEDDGISRGLVGRVYDFGTTVSVLPDFDDMDPIQEILVPNLDVPTRSFSEGFPGVRELIEWFGVRFLGTLTIPTSGTYSFKVYSDDGARMYLNESLIVDNDGVHAPRERTTTQYFEAGVYDFRMDYFQGPRYHITLQLFWDTPESAGYEIVPPDSFGRPN